MRLTQGAYSFLPDLTDEQIIGQVNFMISKGFAVGIEWTEDPHPRNCYWDLWGLPLFNIQDAATVMYELDQCRAASWVFSSWPEEICFLTINEMIIVR